MKKYIKNLLSSCFSSIVLPVAFIAPVFSSCSDKPAEPGLTLSSEWNHIMPGESLQISSELVGCDDYEDKTLVWTVDKILGGSISISQTGLLIASPLLSIISPTKLTVSCCLKLNPTISATCEIYASPLTTSDFLGFEDNNLYCLDRYHETQTIKIYKDSSGVFRNQKNIDLFVNDAHPMDWSSFFYFNPVIKKRGRKEMCFTTDESEKPSIVWSGYLNGRPTLQIPDFTINFFSNIFAYIDVTFKADSNIKLSLTFNLWQARTSVSPNGEISYSKFDSGDEHWITETSTEGDYDSVLFCPANQNEGIWEGKMEDIYIYRKKFEFLDFEFRVDENQKTKELLGDAFKYEFYNLTLFERPIDHYQFYKVSLKYSFDLSLMPSADELEYKSLTLMTLVLMDPLSPQYPAVNNGQCVFSIEWV